MKGQLLMMLIGALPDDALNKIADAALDVAENSVERTKNKIDDAIVLPICAKLRAAFGIGENGG